MSRLPTIFDRLADLALLEEARARMDFGDERLCGELGVKKNTLNLWRHRHHIPAEYRPTLLRIIMDRLRPDEMVQRGIQESLDEILAKVKGIEEGRALLQRDNGPPPGAKRKRA